MPDAIAATMAFLYGIVLIWGAYQITRLLAGLVRPVRPPLVTYLHTTAVWTVGVSSTLAGVAMVVYAMTLLSSTP